MIKDLMYSETSLLKDFGQFKKYYIYQSQTSFADNVIYDNPFSDDLQFNTYTRGNSDFSVEALIGEDQIGHKGFVNYKLVQGTKITS